MGGMQREGAKANAQNLSNTGCTAAKMGLKLGMAVKWQGDGALAHGVQVRRPELVP